MKREIDLIYEKHMLQLKLDCEKIKRGLYDDTKRIK